ncbi:MAG: hypothetical protein BJ554DRAFT_2070, partial [Olpidium bornovanus]
AASQTVDQPPTGRRLETEEHLGRARQPRSFPARPGHTAFRELREGKKTTFRPPPGPRFLRPGKHRPALLPASLPSPPTPTLPPPSPGSGRSLRRNLLHLAARGQPAHARTHARWRTQADTRTDPRSAVTAALADTPRLRPPGPR